MSISNNLLFLNDAYKKAAPCKVKRVTKNNEIILDRSLFYPMGGGQPGDSGKLQISGIECSIRTTMKSDTNEILLIPDSNLNLPDEQAEGVQIIDWQKRYKYMKTHTALHLLSVAVGLPVTGGQITFEKGRLDFNMPTLIDDKQELENKLNDLILANYQVTESVISEEDLSKQPDLIKTLSVSPPKESGKIRLVRIGSDDVQVDLQPCGGTHVKETCEIGPIIIGKIEKKGKQNRRFNIFLQS